MSRILKVLIALLAIATVAAPAFAEDRLSLSGEMRVRHFYMTEYDFDDSQDSTFDAFDQRLRIAGKISVAEGVSVNFRTDITENGIPPRTGGGSGRSIAWAENGQYTQRWSGQSWDKAYLQIDKGMFSLLAGQQYYSISAIAAEHIGTGIVLKMKGKIPVYLAYTKLDENGSLFNEIANDKDFYGFKVGHKTDAYNADLIFATIQGGQGTGIGGAGLDMTAYLYGLVGSFNINNILLKGEFDYFDGENGNVDYIGTQLYLDGSMAVSETATVGLIGLYAKGTDKANEDQLTRLTIFGGWQPQLYGPYTTDFQSEGLAGNDVFDITGDNAGILALEVYSTIKTSDDLSLTGSFLYGAPDTDVWAGTVDDIDSLIIANIGAIYQIATNTSFQWQLNYTQVDGGSNVASDPAVGMMSGLFVKF